MWFHVGMRVLYLNHPVYDGANRVPRGCGAGFFSPKAEYDVVDKRCTGNLRLVLTVDFYHEKLMTGCADVKIVRGLRFLA
jgi:hypothetical protein